MIFYHPGIIDGDYTLPESESHHGVRVMRLKAGDEIEIFDGAGGVYQARIKEAHSKGSTIEVLSKAQHQAPSFSIHLAIAPTKNSDRIEWMFEKCVEVGLSELTFLECQHSERTRVRMDRLQRKMISAMKQSGQYYATILHEPVSFSQFLEQEHQASFQGIAYVNEHGSALQVSQVPTGQSYLILIGPEGDFSSEEIELALTQDFLPISLGKSVLRTETAGLMACCVLNSLNCK